MYRAVYFHKTTRAAEVMLKMIFRRLKALIDEIAGDRPAELGGKMAHPGEAGKGRIVSEMEKVAPGIPPGVVRAFSGAVALEDFLRLDDFALHEFFKSCAGSKDKHLQELGYGLVNRRLYKGIDLTEIGAGLGEFAVKATDFLRSKGAETDYEFGDDTPADTPYKPYDPDQEKPAAQIYVEDGTGRVVEIGTISDPVRTLQKKYHLVRYYFPERYRTEIQAIAAPLMKK
jgi:hypothetical protein